MPDVTITGLPNASALTGAERVPMDQSGTTVDAAASAIAALATKATVGLSNVDNTSDANKPISAATQTALDAKAAAGAIGSSGLTMTAGVLGRESGTGAPVVLTLGSGLSIVGGALTAAGGGGSGTVTSVAMSVPTGFAITGSPITTTGTLALAFAAGYSLPLTASQASWDVAAALAATAVQPAGLTIYVQTSDARLSDSREWSATTVSQATAEAGTSTTRVAYNPLRVFQSIAAYIAANFSAVGQALATAANAAAARTTLGLGTAATAATGDFAAASHTQAASTISDSTTAGRALLTAADATAQRTSLGLGSLSTQSGTFSGTSSGTNTGDQDLSGLVVKANNLSDLASAPTARANLGLGSAATAASGDFLPTTFTAGTITYGATVDLDLAAHAGTYKTISLAGALTFTTSNRASGRTVALRLICDGTGRALTFPAGWVFVGAKPSTIAASKTAVLSLTFYGTADADCVAAYGVQA